MFTIVVASGTSQRFGSDKLQEKIGDETVLDRSVRIALENSDGVIVVVDPATYVNPLVLAIVPGGQTRSQSVKNGLSVVPVEVEMIAVHDGARPGADERIYTQGRELVANGAKAAIPAIEVVDTIKKVDQNEVILATVPRSDLRAVQTPQIFRADVLRQAHKGDTSDTDDSALVENLGYEVVVFKGSETNRKVTTKKDLEILENELFGHDSKAAFRIGSGYDIHPFGKDKEKKLVLGGIEIDHEGLEGHSDSDAVAHALTDALLSAIGAPDLGSLFPASDVNNKDVSSLIFLEKAVALVTNEGYKLGNANIIVNAQEPKLSPHIDEMNTKLSETLAPIITFESQLSITPKHGEGIGEIGQSKAIAVYATVLLMHVAN